MSPIGSSFPLTAFCAAILVGAAALTPPLAAQPMAPFEIAGSDEEVLEDAAEGPEAAKISAEPDANAAAPTDPASAEPGKPAMDEEFRKRQKEADIKLQAEAQPTSVEHRLVKVNPNDYIIVCEAGCRSRSPDEIVSRVPKPIASAATQASFEPTSSAVNAAMDARDPARIDCEAGCRPGDTFHPARLPPSREVAETPQPIPQPADAAATLSAAAKKPNAETAPVDQMPAFAPTMSLPSDNAAPTP